MVNLILKDFKLTKKIFILGFIYTVGVIAVSLTSSMEIGNIIYCILILCMTYLSVLYADGYDETNKGYLILASLPVKRYLLVASKYLSMALYYLIYTIVPLVIMAMASAISGQGFKTYSPYIAVITFVLAGLLYSVYYPIYYKYGYNALKVYKILIFLFIMLMPKLIKAGIKMSFISTINDYRLMAASAVIIVSVLVYLSYMLSVKLYEKKELI